METLVTRDPSFTLREIMQIAQQLDLPLYFYGDNGIKEHRRDALCMLLARLARSKSLADLHLEFGWPPERIYRIVKEVRNFIYRRWRYLLTFDAEQLTPEKLRVFGDVVKNKGAPLTNCWGFVD
ncbi:hypothetical protein FN846DRAFT_896750 [Sphaerosporella brunnea]|uniref:Uncharacterized protein n=1 Tax=Sphaerosporella brunnea TaxID=1250544 RepID=A0A5J5EC06_9PEZI|nr:hypothetical protein FN846DRAFT_896750 [Sphaerosporella brunnea]